jgi:tRNA A37 threonylcarbamoyladenosine biosynthesis protein TsaE
VLIEWPQRLGSLLPKHLSVVLEVDGDGRRALLDV